MEYTDITLNGKPFPDAGSSDLWVSAPVPGAISQNYSAGIMHRNGSAEGPVMSATLDFAGFSVDVFALDGSGIHDPGGLMGLGPGVGSITRMGGNSGVANPPLDRIFSSNSSVSPLLAVLLQRSGDPDEPFPGYLSVGEVLPDYQDGLNQPRLPVTTLLDVNGIIGPNGTQIEITDPE
ncbi:hypothetical protein JVT61DRAFT_1066 [Boletus reticuloceps]|uniref:Uncharacterized protein n=1 Tax=Boletus reticuloceps TaxID=495285 RepID=A0A8I2YR84_9AGAM|nr:hypothetical protein JVT61DRAFT_1066 [Boletus reticuloceps]